MTPSVWLGIAVQLAAVIIVLRTIRKQRLSHAGIYFVLMAFIVYGLTEIIQALFRDYAISRDLIRQQDLDNWIVLGSAAILFFAIAYSVTLSVLRRSSHQQPKQDLANIKDILPAWQLMAAITSFGLLGLNVQQQLGDEASYWVGGLVEQYLLFALVLAPLSYLVKNQGRHVLLTIVVQAGVAFLLTSRTAILVTIVLLIFGLVLFQIPIKHRSYLTLMVLGAFLVTVISVSRAVVGREQLSGDISQRVSGLLQGGQDLAQSESTSNLLKDFVYRFDGNFYPSLVGTRLVQGLPPAGLTPLAIDLFLIVPRFLNPDKLLTADIMRNEAGYITAHLGLPPDVSFLWGTLGVLYGSFGPIGLCISTIVLGILFASIDIWIHRKLTLFRTLVGLAFVYSALTMDVGLIWYFLNLRGVIVLYLLLLFIRWFRNVMSKAADFNLFRL